MSSFKSCHLACRPPFLHNLPEHGGGQFLSLPHSNINFPDSKNVRSKCAEIQIYRVSFSATDKSDKFHHQLLLIPLPTQVIFKWCDEDEDDSFENVGNDDDNDDDRYLKWQE